MNRYLSINLYTFTHLRPLGSLVVEIVDSLFALSEKYHPAKFRADLVGKKRSRYFKASQRNLRKLREELLAGRIRELHINDNPNAESLDPRFVFDTNLYGLRFWLDFTTPLEKLAPTLPSSPNSCQFLIRTDAFEDHDTFCKLLAVSKRAFSGFSSCWGDMYCCSSHHVCFLHFLGSSYAQHRRDASEEFRTITIDRGRFYDTLCDTLARDAYFGVFLNPTHVRLLGGIRRLRSNVPYEVIEELPAGGAFLMASSNPFDFDEPEIQERIERLREVLQPIAMFRFEDSRVARSFAEHLRSGLSGDDLV